MGISRYVATLTLALTLSPDSQPNLNANPDPDSNTNPGPDPDPDLTLKVDEAERDAFIRRYRDDALTLEAINGMEMEVWNPSSSP